MELRIQTLNEVWDIASLFAPKTPKEDVDRFITYLLNKIPLEFQGYIKRVQEQGRFTGEPVVTIVGEKHYGTAELLNLIADKLIRDDNVLRFSDEVIASVGLSSDQIARLLEYGNLENPAGKYITRIFRGIQANMQAYWMRFYNGIE